MSLIERRPPAGQSPDPVDPTQTIDISTQPSQSTLSESNNSDAASEALGATCTDDYTGSSEEDEDEERSVNTETGLQDTQESDSPYLTRTQKRKRKRDKKEAKKAKKASKKHERRKAKKGGGTPPGSPSY